MMTPSPPPVAQLAHLYLRNKRRKRPDDAEPGCMEIIVALAIVAGGMLILSLLAWLFL